MTAAVATAPACPAWCEHEADTDQLHLSEVHEVGDILVNLHQYFDGIAPMIGISDATDQELFLTAAEAERLSSILLQFAHNARKSTYRAA